MVYTPLITLAFIALVLAQIATAQNYHILSVRTKYCLSSNNVTKFGDISTVSDTSGNCSDAGLWRIEPAPSPNAGVTAVIYDVITSLYVGLEEVASGSRLKAVPDKYEWQIYPFVSGGYAILVPGKDYYWIDNFVIPAVLEVESSTKISDNDVFFNFLPVNNTSGA